MLFRKDILPACEYCTYSAKSEGGEILCAKRCNIEQQEKCRLFAYDPCKRIPKKQKAFDFSKYSAEDFSL